MDISLVIAPGSVRAKVAKPSQAERLLAELDALGEMEAFMEQQAEQLGLDLDALDPLEAARLEAAGRRFDQAAASRLAALEEGRPWNVVTAYSRKSRQRCRQMVAETDWYTPLQRDDSRIGMLTVTYPGDWATWAPDPDTCTKHRHALEKRLRRALDYMPSFIWVREFQGRGAPHFHMAGVFPTRIDGERLERWLSRNWFEVVGSGNPKHFEAGTRIDWSKGADASDPNRMAAYFTAYTTGENGKEYQHHPPEGWSNPNGSVGRHWGARGCTRIREELRISPAQLVEAQRFLRRYIASQKRTKRYSVDRQARTVTRHASGWLATYTDRHGQPQARTCATESEAWKWLATQRPGEGRRRRSVNRRWKLASLVGTEAGFTFLTNDGPALALAVATATTLKEETWPPGQPRPLP
ncbi:MAG: hypothetical protein AAF962_08810 [Actinomycetota bacterium]